MQHQLFATFSLSVPLPFIHSRLFSFQLNVREIVCNELELLFECVDREELTYLPCMDNRELLHLQDFHKFNLFKNFGFLQRYAKQKVEQNWTRICETRRTDSVVRPGNFDGDILLNFRLAFPLSLQRLIAKNMCWTFAPASSTSRKGGRSSRTPFE